MTYRDILHEQLPEDEALRHMPYDDATGKPFVRGMTLVGNLTIGVGRNITANGISDPEIEMMLENDITAAEMAARDLLGGFDSLSDVRKAVVVNMAFNLGYQRFSRFHQTLQAIRDCRWNDAADQMKDSDWYDQVGDRAKRLCDAMRSDKWTT